MSTSDELKGHAVEMPEDVRRAFLNILYYSFLSIRGNSKNADICHAFADHAHNIPGLISNYSPDTFKYYWECERPSFMKRIEALNCSPNLFNEYWAVLEKHYAGLI